MALVPGERVESPPITMVPAMRICRCGGMFHLLCTRKHHDFDAVSRIVMRPCALCCIKGWRVIRRDTCGALKQSETHALAQFCHRAVTVFRTLSRVWRRVPLPCINIVLLPVHPPELQIDLDAQ
eukprot:1191615-Prorocentrum_minimum.AAC.1